MLRRKNIGLFLLCLLTLLALAGGGEHAQADPQDGKDKEALTGKATPAPIDWKKGEWGDLSAYIGTYNYEAVLKDPRVAKALATLFGSDPVDLNTYFDVNAPIGFTDDCLVLQGNADARADVQAAYLLACLHKGAVHLALQLEDKLTLYTSHPKYAYVAEQMRLWLYLRANPKADVMAPPPELVLKNPPPL